MAEVLKMVLGLDTDEKAYKDTVEIVQGARDTLGDEKAFVWLTDALAGFKSCFDNIPPTAMTRELIVANLKHADHMCRLNDLLRTGTCEPARSPEELQEVLHAYEALQELKKMLQNIADSLEDADED